MKQLLTMAMLATVVYCQGQTDTTKSKLNYGLTLSGLSSVTIKEKNFYGKTNIVFNPLFYNITFYINKKRHYFDVGIANTLTNINPDNFYYSLCYSYKITRPNKILDISATIKSFSSFYQLHHPSKDVKQLSYNDMIVCFGPTFSKQINRLTFQISLFCVTEVPIYIKQYTNGQNPTVSTDKIEFFPRTYLPELKMAYRLNK